MAFDPRDKPFGARGQASARLKPAATTGEGRPLGASLTTPVPAPLPDRGTGVFFLLSLISAIVAVTFAVLIAFKI